MLEDSERREDEDWLAEIVHMTHEDFVAVIEWLWSDEK